MAISLIRRCIKRCRRTHRVKITAAVVFIIIAGPYVYPMLHTHNDVLYHSVNSSKQHNKLSQQLYGLLRRGRQHVFTVRFWNFTVPSEVNMNGTRTSVRTIQSNITANSSSDACSNISSQLRGRQKVDESFHSMGQLELLHQDGIELGGRHRPSLDCNASHKIAIIVPFRDRDVHFRVFLHNLIPKLKRQDVDFTIFKVEQAAGERFNRGMMRNVGFMEASKVDDFNCYIFNDVDTIIEDDRNIFKCGTKNVRHLLTGVDRYRYKLLYEQLIGGIIGFTKEQFLDTNGYSNFYFMWGAEDDDMRRRILLAKYSIERPEAKIGLVKTLKHVKDKKETFRHKIYHAIVNSTQEDGLSSLKYQLLKFEKHKLYSRIYVKINQTQVMQDLYDIVPRLRNTTNSN